MFTKALIFILYSTPSHYNKRCWFIRKKPNGIHTQGKSSQTRTTRTPAFWGYPSATSWLPILLSHIGSQVKRRQSQTYKFKEFAKISNVWILKQPLHATHLLKLLDKMCKYEMDPMSIVEDTERTRFCPQTDKVKPVYLPFNFVEAGV